MSAHLCHAEGCTTEVPPRLLMCIRHWRMVPKRLKDAVWEAYTPGQERRVERVTQKYLDVAHDAIEAVAEKEGRRAAARLDLEQGARG